MTVRKKEDWANLSRMDQSRVLVEEYEPKQYKGYLKLTKKIPRDP